MRPAKRPRAPFVSLFPGAASLPLLFAAALADAPHVEGRAECGLATPAGCPEFTARECGCSSLFQGSYSRQRLASAAHGAEEAEVFVAEVGRPPGPDPGQKRPGGPAALLAAVRRFRSGLSGAGVAALATLSVALLLCVMAAVMRKEKPRPAREAEQRLLRAPQRRPSLQREPCTSPGPASLRLLPEREATGPSEPLTGPQTSEALTGPPEPPPAESAAAAAPLYLCPELVVPQGSECTLFVPVMSTGAGVSVKDARGVAVFQASLQEDRRLLLSSANGEAAFASCREGEDGQSLGVFTQEDRAFGELRADGGWPANGYSVTARRGWRVRFRGDPEGKHLNAIDDLGRLLAVMEVHSSGSRSVRVGPATDAGMIIICVLGIDLLKQHAAVAREGET